MLSTTHPTVARAISSTSNAARRQTLLSTPTLSRHSSTLIHERYHEPPVQYSLSRPSLSAFTPTSNPFNSTRLGVGSCRPLDSNTTLFSVDPEVNQSPDPENPHPESLEISDQEWELRTGRAIYVLQETLPGFFDTGLITAVDKETGAPKASQASSHHFHIPLLDSLHLPSTSSHSSSHTSGASAEEDAEASESHEEEPIYSSNVRLEYTPPDSLPAPFPKTFKVEGLQLYLASASLVRRTMKTLYSDLNVTLTKVSVHTTPPSPPPPGSSAQFSSLNASSLNGHSILAGSARSDGAPEEGYMTPSRQKEKRLNRDKHLIVRQLVTGLTRVSGTPSEWEVESMYTFSPVSGLIWKHTVNSIQPAPHLAVYHSMRTSLGKLFGFGSSTPTPTANASTFGQGVGTEGR
ncbi:hypothetical protein CC1G_15400 [Coprinopsis cinerea okayama7|uniref:Uncharacterized protein n=1 Tax=Coprinopsis cinerea (strain Okayama-7 / 130 / ATCC MYA-4618 / FGSC 9003) TaxID=240176 RepID=D6RQL5_COPC7|nr:hypothetical protein CC1G_15400 [Coprinopsis cinerea okayama7\|eukprot:XP_002910122.1 hypothetical protein CC1G_15400 [Coprinopsis cinerea okayama7\